MLLISACHLVMFYICAKFHEIILNGIKDIKRHNFYTENNKGEFLQKNIVGATVVNLCMSSGHALYNAKFHEIISNGIKVIQWDTISIGIITKGNNSAKNAGGATVVNVCTSSVMLYISTKFCEMI